MDAINNFIFLCSAEMKYCRIIIHTTQSDTAKFKAFAVDPTSGYLFLTKFDLHNRTGASLLRFSLDGNDERKLISEKIFHPHDVTLNIAMKQVYFLDHYFDFIQQCDYDGGNRKFLQKMHPMKFHRITFFENYFYGAIDRNTSLVQVEKLSTFKRLLIDDMKANAKILKIFHRQIQPKNGKFKACAVDNKCEHLCVPVAAEEGNTTKLIEKCTCREGFSTDLNGKCKLRESRKFIMFVEENPRMLKGLESDSNSTMQIISPIVGLHSNIAFDVDLNNKLIYYTSYADSHM